MDRSSEGGPLYPEERSETRDRPKSGGSLRGCLRIIGILAIALVAFTPLKTPLI